MQLVTLNAIADALNDELRFEAWQTGEGDTLEDAKTQEDIDTYYQRQQEIEQIFNELYIEEPSILDKVGHLYECAFNWVLCGKFAPTSSKRLDINQGLGRWLF